MTSEKKTPEREEVVKLFKRGLQFSEELLAENERLRLELANSSSEELVKSLRARVKALEQERDALAMKFEDIDAAKKDYQERFDDIESEHSQLANLYIAGIQLHASLNLREVLNTITEIVLNLVGAERFHILLRVGESNSFTPVVAEGKALESCESVTLGDRGLGALLSASKVHIAKEGDVPIVVVPLTLNSRVCAAIVIDQMLSQKESLNAVDHELFRLLQTQGAISIENGLLRGREGAGRGLLESEMKELLTD